MNGRSPSSAKRIDMHCHVGLLGDRWPQWGHLSDWYRRQVTYKVFLLYARIEAHRVSDSTLREAAERAIAESALDHVVCLALDPPYDERGQRREDRSHVWVDNDYVLDLRRTVGDKVLLGASVHPYDPAFRERVRRYVGQGAALLKWLPSAQQIDLADRRVRDGLEFLATARDGRPLPLLLHVGPEYAIPSSDRRTTSYDFLSWSFFDDAWNWLRGAGRWHRPDAAAIHANLRAALQAGAIIIFAHCGLPYFAGGPLGRLVEHSDFETVRDYLRQYGPANGRPGRAYADVSACATPFRKSYFQKIRDLPPDGLLFGSDFPTPVFELSAGPGEMLQDLRAVLEGHVERIVIPQDNLLDVNYRELARAFPDHPMFTNFARLLG